MIFRRPVPDLIIRRNPASGAIELEWQAFAGTIHRIMESQDLISCTQIGSKIIGDNMIHIIPIVPLAISQDLRF